MTSSLFRLNARDLFKGLVVAVIAALLTYLSNIQDLATVDWAYIGRVALTTALAYLGKNLLTDENSKVLGKM